MKKLGSAEEWSVQNIEEQEGSTASGVAQPLAPAAQHRQVVSAFQAFADKPQREDEPPKY